MLTTLGRELVRRKLPEKYRHYADTPMTKKQVSIMATEMAKDDPDAYVDILQDLNNLGQAVVTDYGRDAALSYKDIAVSKGVDGVKDKMRAIINRILDDDSLNEQQKEAKIRDLGYKYTAKIQDDIFADNDKRRTAIASQINSGSRGNKTQLMQLQFGNMLMKDALNRDIPYLMMDAFAKGASPMAYWMSASSGRKGFYDVQAATGQSGYLGKQVTAATHRMTVVKDDCGTTDTGVPFKASDPKNVGAVLLKPWKKYPAGTVITDEMVDEADDDDDYMIIRSPMTCKCRDGVCAKCAGLSESGKFPGMGEYVAMNAARSFVEPLTQASISSKHGSGLAGKKVEDPDGEDQPTGFRNIERMFTVPSNFPGGAVIAHNDGTVGSIDKAPQGGHYVNVGEQKLYCGPERTVTVKPGDKIYAGDAITNGVPNPAEVTDLKGIGEGRIYFTNKLNDILSKAGAGTDRRNIEVFTRALLSKVKVTDDDGYKSYLPGDIVDYNEIAADYEPRRDSVTKAPKDAMNMYLEKPVLNYTIGTRVTPSVASNLNKFGFNEVTVNAKEPPFTAKFLRPAVVMQYDENWMPRLSGERLQAGLFDAARKGVMDSYDSKSYVNKIVAAPFKP